jgi:hypothetical protein
MAVPVLVVVVCSVGGALAAAHWLPGLAGGRVGRTAYFAVCGLLGAALGVVGLQTYVTVKELEAKLGTGALQTLLGGNSRILANGLMSILYEGGVIAGLAAIVYVLAVRRDDSAQPR